MYEFLEKRVLEVMTQEVVTVGPATTLREAEQLFQTHDFNGMPVVTGELLLGWLTKLDLLKAFRFTDQSVFPQYEQLMTQAVSAVMTPAKETLTVTPRAPLSRVLEKMVKFRVKSFPVLDRDRLVGVVAREDVLRALDSTTSEAETPRRTSPN